MRGPTRGNAHMTAEEIEQLLLPVVIAGERVTPEQAKDILRRFIATLPPEQPCFRELRIAYHSFMAWEAAALYRSPVYALSCQLFGEDDTRKAEDLVSWEDLCSTIMPILLRMDLSLRLVAALRIMHYSWYAIRRLIELAMKSVQRIERTDEIAPSLDRFRDELLQHLPDPAPTLDPENRWLSELIRHVGPWRLEFASWAKIDRFLQTPECKRFQARNGSGWLRDQWKQALTVLREGLTLRDLTPPIKKGAPHA
jgi:hypothetical protein